MLIHVLICMSVNEYLLVNNLEASYRIHMFCTGKTVVAQTPKTIQPLSPSHALVE